MRFNVMVGPAPDWAVSYEKTAQCAVTEEAFLFFIFGTRSGASGVAGWPLLVTRVRERLWHAPRLRIQKNRAAQIPF